MAAKPRTAADVLARVLLDMYTLEADHRFECDDFTYGRRAFRDAPEIVKAKYEALYDIVQTFDGSAWNAADPLMDRAHNIAWAQFSRTRKEAV